MNLWQSALYERGNVGSRVSKGGDAVLNIELGHEPTQRIGEDEASIAALDLRDIGA